MTTAVEIVMPNPALGRLPYEPRDEQVGIPWKVVLRLSTVPMLLLLLRAAPSPVNAASYPLLAIYSLAGRRQAILSLMLLCTFNTFNHGISLPPSFAAVFRHVNIFAAAFSILGLHAGRTARSTIPGFLWWTAGLSVLLLGHSLVFSTWPAVSVLKGVSFAVTIQALLVGWSSLSRFDHDCLQRQVLTLLSAIAILSAPLVLSSVGYYRNGQGFQGVLVHPQNFGPTMAYLATWLTANWLSTGRRHFWRLSFLVFTLGLLYLSLARVAVAIYAAGVVAVITAAPLAQAINSARRRGKLRPGRLLFAITSVGVVAIALGPFVFEKASKFLKKGNRSDSVAGSVYESRAFIIEEMMGNIQSKPFTGIGFGAPSRIDAASMYGYVEDPIFGLTVMAPVEKGVLPIAMVEEMGIPLATLYFVWMFGLYLLSLNGGPIPAGICAAAFATGLAEAMFFAPGGAGMQTLVLSTMAATWGNEKFTNEPGKHAASWDAAQHRFRA